MWRASLCLGSILAAAILAPASLHADDKASTTAVDTDFLEFLGSLDSDDVAWSAYLNNTDVAETNIPKPTKPPEKTTREGESK
jgi:hypothetical protein